MFKKSLLAIVATALFGFSANSFAGIFDNIFYSSVDEFYPNTTSNGHIPHSKFVDMRIT